jgi:hypothetical protein
MLLVCIRSVFSSLPQAAFAGSPVLGISPFWFVHAIAVSHAGALLSSPPVRQICYKIHFLVYNTGSIKQ